VGLLKLLKSNSGKYKKCAAIVKYFNINSVDDLALKMPFILCHDYQTGINGERREGSLARIISPKDTVNVVYNRIKSLKGDYGIFPDNDVLRTAEFPDPCSNGEYESVIVTCLQQSRFAADFINNYLRYKGGEGKAKVVNVDIYKDGVKLYGHYIAGFNNRLFDPSMNKKFEGIDKSDIFWDEISFDRKVVEGRKGVNYMIKCDDYPVNLDWHTWNGDKKTREKAQKKLNKWKKKHL